MENKRTMSYGKGNVFAYRTFMEPLSGLQPIPESAFAVRDNTVFGINVTVEVGGNAFLSSFTDGDNQMVVATDSMKNFIQRHLATFSGRTIEGFIRYVGEAFLTTYSHIDWVKLTGEAVPFENTTYANGEESSTSTLVYKHSRNERNEASIELVREGNGWQINSQNSRLLDLQLVKVKDNSFVGFIRDQYTTLPEDSNRPLFIYLNIGWSYETNDDALGEEPARYVAGEQVADLASSVFHELTSPSIQHLIYQIGCRMLKRFPQLQEVTFESQNRTWDTVVEDIPETEGKVYTEPRLPFGFQRFSVTKADLGPQTTFTRTETARL